MLSTRSLKTVVIAALLALASIDASTEATKKPVTFRPHERALEAEGTKKPVTFHPRSVGNRELEAEGTNKPVTFRPRSGGHLRM